MVECPLCAPASPPRSQATLWTVARECKARQQCPALFVQLQQGLLLRGLSYKGSCVEQGSLFDEHVVIVHERGPSSHVWATASSGVECVWELNGRQIARNAQQ